MNPRIQSVILLAIVYSISIQAQVNRKFSPTDYQIPAIYEPGAPLGSYAISPMESVNLFNGSLSLTLPLRQVTGRGEAKYEITIPITRYSWTVQVNEVPVNQNVRYDSAAEFEWQHPFQIKFGPGLLLQKQTGSDIEDCGIANSPNLRYSRTYSHLIFLQADGSELQLYGDVSGNQYHAGNGILGGLNRPGFPGGSNK